MLSEALGIGKSYRNTSYEETANNLLRHPLPHRNVDCVYPYISNRINEKHASSAITSYDSEVKQLDEEKVDALKEAATKYNDQLSTVVSARTQRVRAVR